MAQETYCSGQPWVSLVIRVGRGATCSKEDFASIKASSITLRRPSSWMTNWARYHNIPRVKNRSMAICRVLGSRTVIGILVSL